MRLLPSMLVFTVFGCVDQSSFTPIGEISLTGPAKALVIRSRGTIDVPVSVERGTGQDGEIRISSAGLPTGVELDPLVLPPGVTEGSVTLRAAAPELDVTTLFSLTAEARGGKVASTTLSLHTIGEVGTVDSSYGLAGKVTIASNIDRDCRTLQLPGGAVLVDSSPLDAISFTKLLPSGSPDSTFGINGTLTFSPLFGSITRSRNTSTFIAQLPNGRFLVAATGDDPSVEGRYDALIVLRLNANGSLDPTYGVNGFIVIPGALRLWGMVVTPAEESLLLHYATGVGPTMTKLQSNGAFAAAASYTTFETSSSDMMMQPDGKAVAVANEGGGYALVRFTNSLQLDPSFGRNGIMPLAGVPLFWDARSDGSFFGVGIRYNYLTPGTAGGHAVHFDKSWRPLPGFEMGGVTMLDTTMWYSSVEAEGGTLISGLVDGQAGLLLLTTSGQKASDFGVNGWRVVAPLPVGWGGLHLVATGPYKAVLSHSINGQSCQLYRIWR